MNFLFPAAFFLGSLALPIVVLYLRRPSQEAAGVLQPALLAESPGARAASQVSRAAAQSAFLDPPVGDLAPVASRARPAAGSLVTRSSLDCSRPRYASAHASAGYL